MKKKVGVLVAMSLAVLVVYFVIDRHKSSSDRQTQKPADHMNGGGHQKTMVLPPGISQVFADDLNHGPESTRSSNVFRKSDRLWVKIPESKSLDLPQVEFLFAVLRDSKQVPVPVVGLIMDAPPEAGYRYHQGLVFREGLRPCRLRLGVARDSEEAKFPGLLQMGKQYRITVQHPTYSQVTSKLITVPNGLESGMVYQIPVILDHSTFTSGSRKKSVRIMGNVAGLLSPGVRGRYEVVYYQPGGESFHSKLSDSGEFDIPTYELGGEIEVRFLSDKAGYVVALSRKVKKPKLLLADFEWRLDQNKLRDYNWSFVSPVDDIENLVLKLSKADHRPVFGTAIPRTASGHVAKVKLTATSGKYFVCGLMKLHGKPLFIDLGTLTLDTTKVAFEMLPETDILAQKKRCIEREDEHLKRKQPQQ